MLFCFGVDASQMSTNEFNENFLPAEVFANEETGNLGSALVVINTGLQEVKAKTRFHSCSLVSPPWHSKRFVRKHGAAIFYLHVSPKSGGTAC